MNVDLSTISKRKQTLSLDKVRAQRRQARGQVLLVEPERRQPTFRRHVANTLLWLVRNKQQQKAVAYMRLKFSPEALKRAVEQNKLTPRVNA